MKYNFDFEMLGEFCNATKDSAYERKDDMINENIFKKIDLIFHRFLRFTQYAKPKYVKF